MSIHTAVIRILQGRNSRLRTTGFKAQVIGALEEDSASATWIRENWTRIPDAFVVDAGAETVTCIEVEDSHPLDGAKLADYLDLWFLLDCESWELVVLSVDRYGRSQPVPLIDFWFVDLRDREVLAA